jgi:hypothetical protein
MSAASSPLAAEFQGLTQSIVEVAGRALAAGDTQAIASSDLERAMTVIVKLYAAKAEREGRLPVPCSANEVTPTEVVLVVSEMLRALDISLFDLAMWYRRGQTQ